MDLKLFQLQKQFEWRFFDKINPICENLIIVKLFCFDEKL